MIDGQEGGDDFTYTSPAGIDIIEFTPGPGSDGSSGSIEAFSTIFGPLMPVSFSHIFSVPTNLTFADDSGTRTDTLSVRGTDVNDAFVVTAGGVLSAFDSQGRLSSPRAGTPGVANLTLLGRNGSDTFSIPGNHPFTSLIVEGGNPDSGSDVLNFAGAGAAITADLGARTITETGFGPVAITGMETVNIAAAAAALTATLTNNDDSLTYRPSGAAAGTFHNEGDNTTFNFSGMAGTFLINEPGPTNNTDLLIVEGTNNHDLIVVDAGARVVSVTDVNGTLLQPATITTGLEVLTVKGRLGNDTFQVTPAPTIVGFPAGSNLLINVDGGDPGASDALVIATAAGATLPPTDFAVHAIGLNPGEGRVRVFRNAVAMPDISYTNVEIVSPNVVVTGGVPQLLVLGPDASEPNEFRTNATHLGAGDSINVDNLAIFPNFGEHPGVPADVDFFQVVAKSTGTLDVIAFFETYAATLLPGGGQLGINVLDAAGNVIAGAGTFGSPDASPNARVRLPVVQGQVYFVTVFGALANGTPDPTVVNGYELTLTNEAPPVPYGLELSDNPADGTTNPPGGSVNSDTGRSQFDNHTYDTTPTLFFRVDDGIFLNDVPGNGVAGTPVDENIPIPFRAGVLQPVAPGYAIAIFDEGNTPPQTGAAPQTPLGFATAVAGQQGVYTFTVPAAVALSQGSHFLSARVQMIDPATPQTNGFGARSDLLEIVVDTTPPVLSFGLPALPLDGLHPDSDSGDPFVPSTLADRATNDTTPTFFGQAEANSVVRLFVDRTNNGFTADDLLVGQTVASPLDGTNQFPTGYWEITSNLDMNDPLLVAGIGFDGVRNFYLSAEDLAGNITAAGATTLQIFVDTQGPQVTNVSITGSPAYNLFTLKPNNVVQGPTPAVNSLTINIQDLPARALGFLYPALSNAAVLPPIVLRGDHSGIIANATATFTSNAVVAGVPATGFITLTFAAPLPDDRYTLTLGDSLIDPVGNALDGESNAAEPIGTPTFPSGDGIPGVDFIARFTVDSRPEVGSISQGLVYVDINGNQVFDPEGQDNDATNRDFVYQFGRISDGLFAGNFSPVGGAASGFDKLGAYGKVNNVYSFLIDTNDDGVGDVASAMPAAYQVNGVPVAGNFSAAKAGDEIGVFDGSNWYLDLNGNNAIDLGEIIPTNYNGIPLVGDFNGDGNDDLAVYVTDTNQFIFDTNRDGTADFTWAAADSFGRFSGLSGFTDRPVAGDINLDGVDDIGIWVKGRQGVLPKESGEFFFWVSDAANADPSTNFTSFSPAPLGNDLFTQWGDETALPIFGNFDPPVSQDTPFDASGTLTNPRDANDVNNDGRVSALDALIVINAINRGLEQVDLSSNVRLLATIGRNVYYDVDGNSRISAVDALRVINAVQLAQVGAPEPTGEPEIAAWSDEVDAFFQEDGTERFDDLFGVVF